MRRRSICSAEGGQIGSKRYIGTARDISCCTIDPDLNMVRVSLHRGALPTVSTGNGVLVGFDNDSGVSSHRRIEFLGDIQRIPRNCMEFLALLGQHFTDACRLAIHIVRLVFCTLLQQLAVELFKRAYTVNVNENLSQVLTNI